MASPAIGDHVALSVNDGDSDYGSDFSPEEEQIVSQLLSGKPFDIEDNPILNNTEQNDAQQTLRIPLVFGREQKSALYQAARAAEEIAEHISQAIKHRCYYPDCTSSLHNLCDESD
jgi:exonuclease V